MQKDREFWESIIRDALYNKAEYNFLDFKYTLSENNDRLKEHINAFGNQEIGGCFVFGVKNFEPIKIQDDWDSIILRITHLAESTQEPSLSVDAFPIKMGEISLLCLHILPATSKPVFIKDKTPWGGNGCFKRTGSSTVPMSVQEIKDILGNALEYYFDESPVKEAKLEDLDLERIYTTLKINDQNSQLSQRDISMLIDNRILCGSLKYPQVTLAGWLCFAKEPQQIRQFRNAYIEFQVFKDRSRGTPLKKYEIRNTLPDQIEQSIELLKQYIWSIPKIHGIRREDVPAYNELVLREVITNSLVHRDYKKMHQPVKIAMFSNRLEIENPGGLMPGITVLNCIHKRDWRNPLLAELMKKFGFGEMDGQGIDRLYEATLAIKVPPPEMINSENSFKLILSAPKAYEDFTAQEKRFMMIILAVLHETVDNQSVRHCFGISLEKASTLIKSTVAEGILESSSKSKKYAKYILSADYREKIYG